MPRINNSPPLPTKTNFKKKNYRPWNLLDDDFKEDEATHNTNELINKPGIEPFESDNTITKEEAITGKVVTNQYQSDTKTDAKVIPNRYQSDTNSLENWYQSGVKTDTNIDTKVIPNRYQSDTKTGFFSLTGLQKEITILIYTLCQISRNKKTDAVSINQLANRCKSTAGAVKTAVNRLIEKNILIRESFKNGRGGWTVYSVPNNIYQEILNMEAQTKLVPNRYQSDTKVVSELVSEVIPSASSSSGINNINKTTTTGSENLTSQRFSLTNDWIEIDIDPLSAIGFTQTHLIQIASQNKLQPKIVQDSINAFAFDLQENNRAKTIKGDPINFFMGILRNGKPYAPPSNYESPQDKATRLYLERMREIEQKRVEGEKEAFSLAFNDWFSKLSVEQKRELLPPQMRRTVNLETSKMLENTAKSHFEKEIWALNKMKIIFQE